MRIVLVLSESRQPAGIQNPGTQPAKSSTHSKHGVGPQRKAVQIWLGCVGVISLNRRDGSVGEPHRQNTSIPDPLISSAQVDSNDPNPSCKGSQGFTRRPESEGVPLPIPTRCGLIDGERNGRDNKFRRWSSP